MISYTMKSFSELNVHELYQIMVLRQEVFVVEQKCFYLDADGKDQNSFHLMGWDEQNRIQAYCRLIPKGISYEHYTSIGRVVNSLEVRGTGEGKMLMQEAINETIQLWPDSEIKISAQCYLKNFYQSFGFQIVGAEYQEDGIPHVGMILYNDK